MPASHASDEVPLTSNAMGDRQLTSVLDDESIAPSAKDEEPRTSSTLDGGSLNAATTLSHDSAKASYNIEIRLSNVKKLTSSALDKESMSIATTLNHESAKTSYNINICLSNLKSPISSAPVQKLLLEDEELLLAPTSLEAPRPPPNGGGFAWLQVAGSWCLMFNCWGIVNTWGVFQTFYQTELLQNESASDIAWIGSIQAFLLLFVGALTGPLYDYGYFRHLLASGAILMVLGMMMLSLCTEYWQIILAQGVVVGLGGGCLFVPSVAILPTYFTTRMAFSIGVAGSGSGIGGIVYPIAFRQLLGTMGFAWATRVIGFIMLGTLIFPLVVMRPRIMPSAVRKMFDASAWREPPFYLFAIGGFFGFVGMYMPLTFVTTYAIQEGIMSVDLAFSLLPILNAGSTLGRILPNYAADKTGPLNMFVPTCLSLSALSFAWIGIRNSPGLIVFTAIYGFFSGTFLTLPFSTVVTLSPHMGVVGVRMGMACAVVSLGLLVGSPVGGLLLKTGFMGLQAFGASALLASGIAIAASRVCKVGWRLRVKA